MLAVPRTFYTTILAEEGEVAWPSIASQSWHQHCRIQTIRIFLRPNRLRNFTFFYAKAIALSHTLDPATDIGQGSTYDHDLQFMKLKVINNLMLQSWTYARCPSAM
jgi:hypothetical protein